VELGETVQLEIIYKSDTMGGIKQPIEPHFGQPMRVIQEKLSVFEQWQVRPSLGFIAKAWAYRIVRNDGCYCFGTIRQ